jgi:hypothetical protein
MDTPSDNTRWRPDMSVMREWRTGEDRTHGYFIWLQSQNPLPEVPVGEDHPMFADMLCMLRKLHTYNADTLAQFRAGGFESMGQVEYYENTHTDTTAWGRTMLAHRASREKTRELIREMLRHNGDFDDALVEKYFDDLASTIMSFSGPMG